MNSRLIVTETIRKAIFGAGCYWGSEAAFRRIPGVMDTCVGYMEDSLCGEGTPTSDDGAHALHHVEVVAVDYSPDTVTYQDLLELFWDCHDPTGPPYDSEGKPGMERSVIFVADDAQKELADTALAAVVLSGRFDAPVTTVVERVGHFHRARENQQQYLERNDEAVCSLKHKPAEAAE